MKLPLLYSWPWERFVLVIGGVILLGVIGFAGTVVATENNEFCISCHEIDYAYQGWAKSTHVSNTEGVMTKCVDCHVPPQLLDLTFSKVESLNEVYSHWFKPSSDPFWWQENLPRLREHARERMKDDACLRCHKWRFEPVSPEGKIAHATANAETRCVQCHQHLVHNAMPAYTTLRVRVPVTPALNP